MTPTDSELVSTALALMARRDFDAALSSLVRVFTEHEPPTFASFEATLALRRLSVLCGRSHADLLAIVSEAASAPESRSNLRLLRSRMLPGPLSQTFDRSQFERRHDVSLICFNGRSGTFLLHSHLDGHPELAGLAGNAWEMFYLRWRSDVATLTRAEALLAFGDDLAYVAAPREARSRGDDYCSLYGLDDLGADRKGCISDVLDADRFWAVFDAYFDRYPAVSRRELFLLVHHAYGVAIGRYDVSAPLEKILFHLHNSFRTPQARIAEDFGGDVRVLNCVRDPLGSFTSFLRWLCAIGAARSGRAHGQYAFGTVENFLNGGSFQTYSPLLAVRPWSPSRLGSVRLEDMHADLRGTMGRVASHLGIGWSDTLLESSFGGMAWSNVKNPQTPSGPVDVKARAASAIDEYLDPFDIDRLCALTADRHAAWGYVPRSSAALTDFSASDFERPFRFYQSIDGGHEKVQTLIRDAFARKSVGYQHDYVPLI